MDIAGVWVGTINGTNFGTVLMKLDALGKDGSLTGITNIKDAIYDMSYTLNLVGTLVDRSLKFQLSPGPQFVHAYPGQVSVDAAVVDNDTIKGEWKSTRNTHGIFRLTRQSLPLDAAGLPHPPQQKHAAFVIMSFAKHAADTLSSRDVLRAVERACGRVSIPVRRVDEVEHSGLVTDQIYHEIRSNRFLICDLTHERPNVYYELGYAHGLQRSVILVAQAGTKAHFDVAGYKISFYGDSSELEDLVHERLTRQMTESEQAEFLS